MAVVTHHRPRPIVYGRLIPGSRTRSSEEPPVSPPDPEMVIGAAFARWSTVARPARADQPVNNCFARWEMRNLHVPAHQRVLWWKATSFTPEEARDETSRCRSLSRLVGGMPGAHVIAGEKPENERFPVPSRSYSIEAMMQTARRSRPAPRESSSAINSWCPQNIRFQERGRRVWMQHDLGRVDRDDRRSSWSTATTTPAPPG